MSLGINLLEISVDVPQCVVSMSCLLVSVVLINQCHSCIELYVCCDVEVTVSGGCCCQTGITQ